ETVSDCIARILEREPDWKALPISAPPRIVDLLRRCLQKDARQRLRDVGDARIEIDEIIAAPSGAAIGAPTGRKRWPTLWGLGAAALAFTLTGVLGARWIFPRMGPRPGDHAGVVQVARLTHDPGLSEWPTWSPDGSLLAFSSNRSGNYEIYVRRVEG